MMFADIVVLCARGEIRAGVGTGAVEGSHGEERNESVEDKDRIHVSKWNAIRKCSYAICPAATVTEYKYLGSTLQSDGGMSRAYRDKQEDTVWMEQLEEDVRRPIRQESATTREGKDTQYDRSASYAVRDGDSASH